MPHAKSLQLYLTLCNPMDWSLTDFSAHGILQTKILEWVPCPPPWDLPDPGIEPTPLRSPALAGGFFTTITTWEAIYLYIYMQNITKIFIELALL